MITTMLTKENRGFWNVLTYHKLIKPSDIKMESATSFVDLELFKEIFTEI